MRAFEILTEQELDELNRRDFLRKGALASMGVAFGTAALDQGAHVDDIEKDDDEDDEEEVLEK